MSDLIAARDQFAVRYYRWALEDFRREVREGLPLLRTIKGSFAVRAVTYMDSFGGDQLRLATALVKRAHPKALTLVGESPSPEEEALIAGYDNGTRLRTREEDEYNAALLADAPRLKINRGRFLSVIKEQLAPVFGNEGEPFSTKDEWRYQTGIGEWTVQTYIDVGGSVHQLAYSHAIRAAEHRYLNENVSIFRWLGIGGQTSWNLLTDADTSAAALSISRVCAHFVRAAPDLLSGLSA